MFVCVLWQKKPEYIGETGVYQFAFDPTEYGKAIITVQLMDVANNSIMYEIGNPIIITVTDGMLYPTFQKKKKRERKLWLFTKSRHTLKYTQKRINHATIFVFPNIPLNAQKNKEMT